MAWFDGLAETRDPHSILHVQELLICQVAIRKTDVRVANQKKNNVSHGPIELSAPEHYDLSMLRLSGGSCRFDL